MERPIEKLKELQEDYDRERKQLMIECDMLQGNINRMMVTDNHEELLTMFAYAHHRLDNIYWQNKKRINLKAVEDGNDGR
jgi:hypothetical protein